jgi:hypothetical protein
MPKSKTPEEAIAGMAWIILQKMSEEDRAAILQSEELMLELVDAVKRVADDIHQGARLNDMSLDEFFKAMQRLHEPKGNA